MKRLILTATTALMLTTSADAASYSGMPRPFQGDWCHVRTTKDNDATSSLVRYFLQRCDTIPTGTKGMSITPTQIINRGNRGGQSCQFLNVRDSETYYGRVPHGVWAPTGTLRVAYRCMNSDGTSFDNGGTVFRLYPDAVHNNDMLMVVP
jgi:hypothetical protein